MFISSKKLSLCHVGIVDILRLREDLQPPMLVQQMFYYTVSLLETTYITTYLRPHKSQPHPCARRKMQLVNWTSSRLACHGNKFILTCILASFYQKMPVIDEIFSNSIPHLHFLSLSLLVITPSSIFTRLDAPLASTFLHIIIQC